MVGPPLSKMVLSTDHNKGFQKANKSLNSSLPLDICDIVKLFTLQNWSI